MIINEKALAAAMKDSYKGEGYEVAGYSLGEDRFLLLHGIGWMVEMPLANAPRKILGLMAEHLGVIPGPDEAYRVRKRTGQQTEIPAMILREMEKLDNAAEAGNPEIYEQIPLTYTGHELWQESEGLKIVAADSDMTQIARTLDHPVCIGGNTLLWIGKISRVAVTVENWEDHPALRFLEQKQWAPGATQNK